MRVLPLGSLLLLSLACSKDSSSQGSTVDTDASIESTTMTDPTSTTATTSTGRESTSGGEDDAPVGQIEGSFQLENGDVVAFAEPAFRVTMIDAGLPLEGCGARQDGFDGADGDLSISVLWVPGQQPGTFDTANDGEPAPRVQIGWFSDGAGGVNAATTSVTFDQAGQSPGSQVIGRTSAVLPASDVVAAVDDIVFDCVAIMDAGTCDYVSDGECDEPEGTDLCPDGTDVVDCYGPPDLGTTGTGSSSGGWGTTGF